ncbi:MAG: hypothetical protein H7281_17570 [Bacteriovorax sp.]|nr:hypothetical protein [Bacteriovorax sp.]
MTKYYLKTIFITFLSSSLVMLHAQEVDPGGAKKNENLIDSLTMTSVAMLAKNLKSYTQVGDVAAASGGGDSFISGDVLNTTKTQNVDAKAIDGLKGSAPDQGQMDILKDLRSSLKTAYDASVKKRSLQNSASEAFASAGAAAKKLAEGEKTQEKKCTSALEAALTAVANSVNQKCSDLGKDPLKQDEARYCSDELSACIAKINTDKSQFNTYIETRNKPMASIAGLEKVTGLRSPLIANFPGSLVVCSNYSMSLAEAETAGSCPDKMGNDKKNESSGKLDSTAEMRADSISVEGKTISKDLDLSMLIPEHRSVIWGGMKLLADSATAATTSEIEKINTYIVKTDSILGGMGKLANGIGSSDSLSTELSDDDKTIGITTNGGATVSVGLIKKFFATNPSPDAILKEAAGMGLTTSQIAHAMNIAGYGGEKPSDPNNFAQTKALEEKYSSKINQTVAEKGGNFNGAGGTLQVPGIDRVDTTKNVMSVKGWITPATIKQFLDSNPTDQQFFAKMSEFGLRSKDIGTILNGQGLLFKDGDPRQILLNDVKNGSILNRLQGELYQGVTGYGQADTYDSNSLIVPGTGHIMDETNTTWIPYGFKSISNQHVRTDNQAPAPISFVSGGQFGNGAKAIKSLESIKVIKPSELKKLRGY